MENDVGKQKSRRSGASNPKPKGVTKPSRKSAAESRAPGATGNKEKEDGDNYSSLKGLFKKDLTIMMYGFGDAQVPLPATVDLVEDIALKYVNDLLHSAMDNASNRGKLTCNDLLYMVRKDARKYARAKELIHMNEELKSARKAFEEDELGNGNEEEPAED